MNFYKGNAQVLIGRFLGPSILQACQSMPSHLSFLMRPSQHLHTWIKGLVKKYKGGGGWVGRSREGVGHEVLSLVQGVGRAIFSYP